MRSALPRFMNRGLIEARRAAPPYRIADSLPRFMNRGLIEAMARAIAAEGVMSTSPIHESGPH